MSKNRTLTKTQKDIVAILLTKLYATIEQKKSNDVYYDNIRLLGSDYTSDVFIAFDKVILYAEPEPSTTYWRIEADGTLDDDALHNLSFPTLGDRVHFFNSLFNINI